MPGEAVNLGASTSGRTGAAYLPDIAGMGRLEAACAYADAGIFVFPVDGKVPIPSDTTLEGEVWSRSWKEFSTRDADKLLQWGKALWNPNGDDWRFRKGIGIDLGKSGLVCIDVDRPDCVPDTWWPYLESAPFESTDAAEERRGHYFFRQPDKRVGNPREAWGEVKGMGGLVIAAPSPHASAHRDWPRNQTPEAKHRSSARYAQMCAGPIPVLPEAIASSFGEFRGAQAAVSAAEARAFTEKYRDAANEDPNLLPNIVNFFAREAAPGLRSAGRHPTMVRCCAWAAKAAKGGLLDADMAHDALKDVFNHVKGAEVAPGEFEGMWEWGVAQATDQAVTEFLTAREQKLTQRAQEKTGRNDAAREAVAEAEAIVSDITETTPDDADTHETKATAPDNRPPGKLPVSFYDRRPVLKHIRQAAHAAGCSADAVLYASLTRLSAIVDHRIRVNTGVKKPVGLGILTGIVGASGAGKSSSIEEARDIFPLPEGRDFLDGLPVGSGEGIAEALMGTVDEEDPSRTDKNGNPRLVPTRRQVRHNAFFDVDEGDTLIRLGSREGSSLWPTIRSLWSGGVLGQQNATAERNRIIPARSYAISMIVGFQEPNAVKVIQDNETGTAQRFFWVQAVDPDIPLDETDHPGDFPYHPQEMSLGIVHLAAGVRLIELPVWVKRQLRRDLVLRNQGAAEADTDPLNAHANLAKVKLSALLALADGRDAVDDEDWELAAIMWEHSCELRTHILEQAQRKAAAEARERTETRVKDAVAQHTAKAAADRSVEIRARWVWEKASAQGVTSRDLHHALGSKIRHTLRGGIELALTRDWVVVDEAGVITRGTSQPGSG